MLPTRIPPQRPRRRPVRRLPVVATLLLAVTGAFAQDQAAQGDGTPQADSIAALVAAADTASFPAAENTRLGRVALLETEYLDYAARLATAAHEDSLVLTLQIEARVDAFMTTLPQVVADCPGADAGPDAAGQRAVVAGIGRRILPALWRLMEQRGARIDDLREQRRGTPPADRPGLEIRIAHLQERLDALTGFAGRFLDALRDKGLPVGDHADRYRTLLKGRADDLVGRMRLDTERLTDLKARRRADTANKELATLQAAVRTSLDANTKSLRLVVDRMQAEGMSVTEQQAQLLSTTQDLASGLLDARATATLLRRLGSEATAWLRGNGPTWLLKLGVFIAIVVAGRLLARVVRKAVETSLARESIRLSQLLRRTIVSSAHNAVVVIAVMIGLAQLGLNLGPLLAGFGVVGFILGFAMQDSLSNFAAGLMILFYRPYDVGDLVDISGVFGKVENMSLVSTSILTLDNQKLVVPNSKIWGDVIKNVTDQRIRRVDMTFGISYSDDIPHAEAVLENILAEHDKVLDDPEPMVRLHTLGDSSVDFVVRPWVKTADYWDVYWDVTRAVKMRFDAENISIPFPQRDVHLHQPGPAAEAEAEG